MPLTLANKITITRIFAIPLFVLVLLYYINIVSKGGFVPALRWIAFFIFVSIFLLDALDGYLARKRKEITNLGKLLDPIADKSLLISALILLSSANAEKAFDPYLPVWFVLIAISRDIILIVGALVIQNIAGKVIIQPRISGKITTFLQGISIVWVLLGLWSKPFLWLLFITAFFTCISAIQYLLDGIKQLEKSKQS